MSTEVSLSSTNTVTVALYLVDDNQAANIITKAASIISKEDYILVDSAGMKKEMPGTELMLHYIDNLTISAGLPHNEYGQTVKIVFSLRKRHLSIRDTLVMGA